MARAQATDFIHSFRYQVVADVGAPAGELFDPEAGFSSVTVPEMNVEVSEYKEGKNHSNHHSKHRNLR